jgi:hypothetical protein
MPTGIPLRIELHDCPICLTPTNRKLYCSPECYNEANKHYAKNRSTKVRKSTEGKLNCLKCGKKNVRISTLEFVRVVQR